MIMKEGAHRKLRRVVISVPNTIHADLIISFPSDTAAARAKAKHDKVKHLNFDLLDL